MAEVGYIWGKEPGDINKIYNKDAGTISKVVGLDFSQGIKIPAGLIVPLRGAGAVPSGWSIFSSANAKYIIGAGSTYSPGQNGAGTGNVNLSHLGGGTHLGTNTQYGWWAGYIGQTTQPNHTHTSMIFTSPDPYYTQNRLIKAGSEQDVLPQDACLMKHATGGWTGLTRLVPATGSRYFKANSADGSGSKLSMAITTSSDGGHGHTPDSVGELPTGSGSTSYASTIAYGAHTHTFTAAISITLQYYLMNLWYSASGSWELDGENFIGMYESLTPPAKWSLCNGSNGTPDLRNRFILHAYSDSTGAAGGSNLLTCSSVTDSQGGHIHYDSRYCNSCDNYRRYHLATYGAHTHTCNHSAAWLPPYYALAFIMYTG